MTDTYKITADQLRSFIERYETLEAEKKQIAEHQKEVMLEAKGCGYCVQTLKRIVSDRKKNADQLAEMEAIYEMYKTAISM